jgi:hypothetical protein
MPINGCRDAVFMAEWKRGGCENKLARGFIPVYLAKVWLQSRKVGVSFAARAISQAWLVGD